MGNNTKDTVKFLSSVLSLVAGIVLVFISIYMPPLGSIHPSVLTALGEILTFVGACWGIGQYTDVMIKKIDKCSNKEDR